MTEGRREDLPRKGLNRAVKTGMVWLAVERGGLQVLNLVASAILARLLGPAAFGIMGMSQFFTGLSRRLGQMGFGAAVIRRPEIRPDHLSTLLVLTIVVNTSIYLLLVALSPFAGRYFGNPLVGEVLRWMALVFILRIAGVVPSAILRRRMDFASYTYASFLDAIVKMLVSVVLAFAGYGVWALVYGELAGGLIDKIYMWWRARWIPSLRVTRAALRDLTVYGVNMSLRGLVTYAGENMDNLVVGRTLGMSSLGFYEKSYNLMRMPVAELSARLGVVLFPALASIQSEPGRFRAAFRKTLLSSSLIGTPLFATLVVLGGPAILTMYGPRWAPAIVPFQLLCISGPLRITGQLCSSAIDACGNLGRDLRRRFIGLGILVAAVFIGVRWGLSGVAFAVLCTSIITFLMLITLLDRVTPLKMSDVLRPQIRPVLATLVLVAVEVLVAATGARRAWPPAAILVVGSAAGGVVYAAAIYVMRDAVLTALWNELTSDVRSAFAAARLQRSSRRS